MNKAGLARSIGKDLRLRPAALRRTPSGKSMPPEDDFWKLESLSDSYARIHNLRTDHVLDLGLDNVREFRSPDFLILRCQLMLEGARIRINPIYSVAVEKNLSGFETLLLDGQWRKEIIGNADLWVSETDSTFQIEVGECGDRFSEEWTRIFPDKEGCFRNPVYLKIGGVPIKELSFVYCDGGRILVPVPEIVTAGVEDEPKQRFQYRRDSLEYKVGELIGEFYRYDGLPGVASHCGIEIV